LRAVFFGRADCDGYEAQRISADKEEIPPRWRPIGANQFLAADAGQRTAQVGSISICRGAGLFISST
jgi:hypothetical protein